MDVQELLNEELESAEKKAVSLKGKPRLIDVFRINYEPWTTRLFPAWKLAEDEEGLGKSSYRRLATLLVKCGYDKVTEETVARYMSLIRKERETRGSVKSSSLTPKVQGRPGAVAVVTPPVVEEEVAPRVVKSRWVDPSPSEVDGRYQDLVREWGKELVRVRSEQESSWSDADEDVWQHLLYLKVTRSIGVYREDWMKRGGGSVVADVWGAVLRKRGDLGLPRPKL